METVEMKLKFDLQISEKAANQEHATFCYTHENLTEIIHIMLYNMLLQSIQTSMLNLESVAQRMAKLLY